MSERPDIGHDDELLAAVYAWAIVERRVAEGGFAAMARELDRDERDCREACDALVSRHILIQTPAGLIAASPDVAIAALIGPRENTHRQAELELMTERGHTARLRTRLAALAPVYTAQAREGSAAGVDTIADQNAVRALISDLTATCDSEIMACQPGGGRPPAALADAMPRDLELLGRGIVLRSLYQHTARFHAPTQAYAETVLTAGSQIRTVAEIPGQMIIIDRRLAFLPHAEHQFGAIIVREPSVLSYLCAAFEQSWNLGTPYQTGPSAAHMAVAEVKASILTLLSNGLKDDVIAKRIGLSVRACRGHIADLMESLGARSRFQAGVTAARSGMLEPRHVGGTDEASRPER